MAQPRLRGRRRLPHRPQHPSTDHPYVLATYIEGDVTRYRFTRHEEAAHAGRLWAVGTPTGAA